MKWPDLDLDRSIQEGHYELDHDLLSRLNKYLSAAGCTCWFEENSSAYMQFGRIHVMGRYTLPGRLDWNSLYQVVACYADYSARKVWEFHKALYALYAPFLPFRDVSSDEELSLRLATIGY